MNPKYFLKTNLFLFLGLFISQSVCSNPISRQKAQQNVQEFLQQKGIDMKLKTLRQAPMSAEKQMESAPYYVFNIGDDNGFVIASGDDCAYEILGYSDKGSFDADSIPDGMKWMLDFYAKQIEASSGKPINKKATAATSYPAIAPMLTTKWDQTYPYNANCPLVNGERCVTGCVATAMAQVMYYHRKYSTDKVIKRIPQTSSSEAIPKGSFIDWDNMLDTYSNQDYTDEQVQAVANLMRYCGVAVRMGYGVNSSWAFYEDIDDALTTYFDYLQPKYVEREGYSHAKWEEMVYSSLAKGDPVIYGGGRHAFVLDGHDGNGYVHVNWGWGGYRDDYFLLSAVEGSDESVLDGFSYNQKAVLFAEPNDRDLESVSLTLRSNRVVENISSLESIPLEFDLEVTNTSDDYSTFYVDVWPIKDSKKLSWFEETNDANMANVRCHGNKTIKKKYSVPANISPGHYILSPYCDRYNSSNELMGRPHKLINQDLYISMIVKDDKATFYVGKPTVTGDIISFEDAAVKNVCINHWDIDEDGEINSGELELITDLGTAFKENKSIKSFNDLQLFTGLTSISDHAFEGAVNLISVTIPETIKTIGLNAFKATKLNSVSIPKNVNTIKSNAFSETPLTSITVSQDNKWYDSRNNCNAIIETTSNKLIKGCENTVIPDEILEIGYNAFKGCSKLTSITLPEGLTRIGSSAFESTGLISITIPESVTEIGSYTFSATELSSIRIPKNVKYIGSGAFSYTSLWEIEVDSDNQWYDSRYDCNAIIKTSNNELIVGGRNTIIPDDVTSIGDDAFKGAKGIESIEIPINVTSIDSYTFCNSSLKSIKIWNVDDWFYGQGAFYGCDELTSIQIYMAKPPTNIFEDRSPFSDDIYNNATLYVVAGAKAAYEKAKVWRKFSNIVEKEDIVEFESEEIKQICVDNWDISGDGEVSEYELSLVKDLNGVFNGYNHNYVSSGGGYENTFHELRNFTGLTSIGDYEFVDSPIWSVVIPKNVTSIGYHAFQSLYDIYIPEKVKHIDNYAFSGLEYASVSPDNKWYDSRNDCNAIIETATNTLIKGSNHTVIPDDIEVIGDYALANCYSFSGNLSIPESVKSIGNGAFSETYISSLTIPKNVKEIGSEAFGYCDFLSSVTVNWINPIEISNSVFSSWYRDATYETCTLYVPRGTKAIYETAEVWKKFYKIEEFGNLVGDVNGDGQVNVVDVTVLVNHTLGNEVESFDETVADMNDDGKVNIADVTSLVNYILSK